jgi:hypothetical protein
MVILEVIKHKFYSLIVICNRRSREQDGIDLITSKDFSHPFVKSELTEMKTGHVKSSCMNILSLILLVQG